MKVLVVDNVADTANDILNEAGIEAVVMKTPSPDELLKIIGEYDGILLRNMTKITKEVLDCAQNLKIIARAGVGVDNIDVDYAAQKGIWVVNSPDGNTEATAEHTISMILGLSRKLPQAYETLKSGEFNRKRFLGNELLGKTLGVVGFGKIGARVAEIAKVLGMNIVVYDPYAKEDLVLSAGFQLINDLDEFLPLCDYITVHVPRTKETIDLINFNNINKLKTGVKLINCARGGIINETALKDALLNGHVSGAALDVFENEPDITNSPFYPFEQFNDNLIIVPHLGASTVEAQVKVAKDVSEQTVLVLKGGLPRTPVNQLI